MLVLLNAEREAISWLAYADVLLLFVLVVLVAPASVSYWRNQIFNPKNTGSNAPDQRRQHTPYTVSDIRNCWFRFECSKKWHDLTETNNSKVRFCSKCEKTVHLCLTSNELKEAIEQNLCVAVRISSAASEPKERLGDPFAFIASPPQAKK